ncbi:Arsenate reductase glutaredoxin-coupled, LMWP family [hydrothermal vent metagenome]|uniref:Arsenate reductase glutaredoxin-coupled, LMWP family n=1 Tax=hydrothermal vent metagenome TaxID=652676 RepID=A0A3B0RFN1_9ZZZZ
MSQHRPKHVLFACTMNSIRSPMAAALVRRRYKGAVLADSCGVYDGYLDPFMVQVMEDWGVDMAEHTPKNFDDLDLQQFDLIIVLTGAAEERAKEILATTGPPVEFWDTPNPTEEMFGPRDLRIMAYSDCRNFLDKKIALRFRRT